MNLNLNFFLLRKRHLLIILFLICNIKCFIKISFKYYPSDEKINNSTNIKDIIISILDLTMVGLLEMGSPKQIINIPIRFGSNTFFLPQKSSYFYNINNNFNLYDDRNSTTFSIIKESELYEGENFEEALYVNDIFYFGKEIIKLDFYLSTSYFFPQMGGLGIQLYPSNDINSATPSIDKTFLRKLKLKGLINNYIWTIIYNTKNSQNIDGYILIGDYPHLVYNYSTENNFIFSLNSIEAKIYNNKIIETQFIMDNVLAITGDKKIEINIWDSSVNAKLDYNFGGILAPEEALKYFEKNVFNDNICYKDTINRISTNIFFYCQNNRNVFDKLKQKFPLIKFESKVLNNSFYININDILFEKDKYIYILLIFEEGKNAEWTLGIPFLKKYQFSINLDSKRIYNYKKIESFEEKEEKKNYIIYYLLIIIPILIILFLIFGFYKGIILINKNKRKKRKNEIDDDNYDYKINDCSSENDKVKEKLLINDE